MRTELWMGLLLTVAGCTPMTPEPTWTPPEARIDEDQHVPPPIESVRDIMSAKLAHAHALMEGIALGDHQQVEDNALDLQQLSREAGWRVHTTVAYGLFSNEFGQAAADLAAAAGRHDASQVAQLYSSLISSCVRCHDYMSSEGLYRDHPGAVSWRPARADHLAILSTTP